MSPTYDHDFWEQLWAKTLNASSDHAPGRPPSRYLTDVGEHLRPGRALDAGCGHGTEALWLATHGWRVTAVDFSETALAHAGSRARAAGANVADAIDFLRADLSAWTPQPERYDLVTSLYVHIADSVQAAVQRLASAVTPAGTLLLVGHQRFDPATGTPTAAAGQQQVSVPDALAVLDAVRWEIVVAEDRPRVAGTGVDAVIHARRLV